MPMTTDQVDLAHDLILTLDQCDTADAAITMAVGTASMCWDNVSAAGVFQSDRALVVAAALAAHLRDRWCIPTPPGSERLFPEVAA